MAFFNLHCQGSPPPVKHPRQTHEIVTGRIEESPIKACNHPPNLSCGAALMEQLAGRRGEERRQENGLLLQEALGR